MFVLDNIRREVQEASNLCWAAVSTMAVRSFDDDPRLKNITQRQIVTFKESEIRTFAQLKDADPNPPDGVVAPKLKTFRKRCELPGSCNDPSFNLHLFEAASTKVGPGLALTADHFLIEIGMRKRPVPIRWQFKGEIDINGRRRKGDHALLVTGYNPEHAELRIFDPWPAPEQGEVVDFSKHEKWISHNKYLDPESDHGLDAFAKHQFDEFKLRRVNEAEPTDAAFDYPPLMAVSPRVMRRENSIDFAQSPDLGDLHAAIDKFLAAHVVRNSSGNVIHGPYTPGTPIPVVPLQVSDILTAVNLRDPSGLFKSDTSTVAVPILREREMIDSVLMLHSRDGSPNGRWHPGGYCNNRVASLLLQAKEIHAQNPEVNRFYLVSIPELSTFFVAHGYYHGVKLAGLGLSKVRNLQGCQGTLETLID